MKKLKLEENRIQLLERPSDKVIYKTRLKDQKLTKIVAEKKSIGIYSIFTDSISIYGFRIKKKSANTITPVSVYGLLSISSRTSLT